MFEKDVLFPDEASLENDLYLAFSKRELQISNEPKPQYGQERLEANALYGRRF